MKKFRYKNDKNKSKYCLRSRCAIFPLSVKREVTGGFSPSPGGKPKGVPRNILLREWLSRCQSTGPGRDQSKILRNNRKRKKAGEPIYYVRANSIFLLSRHNATAVEPMWRSKIYETEVRVGGGERRELLLPHVVARAHIPPLPIAHPIYPRT